MREKREKRERASEFFFEEGKEISIWLKTRLFEIEEAEHTFGATQPWLEDKLPEHLQKVCEITCGFFLIDYTT